MLALFEYLESTPTNHTAISYLIVDDEWVLNFHTYSSRGEETVNQKHVIVDEWVLNIHTYILQESRGEERRL